MITPSHSARMSMLLASLRVCTHAVLNLDNAPKKQRDALTDAIAQMLDVAQEDAREVAIAIEQQLQRRAA